MAENEKMTVFDVEINVALVRTQIGTSYFIDIPCDQTY